MSTTDTTDYPGAAHPTRLVTLKLSGSDLSARFAGPSMCLRDVLLVASELGTAMSCLRGRLRVLVLDFSAVEFLSSIGLGMCVDLCQQARTAGARTIVKVAGADLARLMRLMKIDRLCAIARSDEDLQRLLAA